MRFQITKGFWGRVIVAYECPRCKTGLTSPIDDAGNSDACPECGATFMVPGSDAREKVRGYHATLMQEQHDRKAAKREARRKKFADMTLGQCAGYWILTVL